MARTVEEFKGITTIALRTIAGKKELDVSFSAGEPPTGKITSLQKPRLPLPDHQMSAETVRLVRGCADAHALRIAHHNSKLFFKTRPQNSEAQAVFDALEQARCEALGIEEMSGVANNLHAVLDEKCKRSGMGNITAREQASMADAMHVLARAALTGEEVPPAAKKMAELWQPWLKKQLKKNGFNDLKPLIDDQKAYAEMARKLLRALDLDDEDSDNKDSQEDSSDDAEESSESDKSEQSSSDQADPSAQSAEGLDEGQSDEQTARFETGY